MKLKIEFTKKPTNKSAGSKSLKDAASAFTRESRFFILYRQRGFSLTTTINAEESPFSESYYMARRIIIHYNIIITAAEEEDS